MRFSAAMAADRLLPQRLALRVKPWLGSVDAILFATDERGEASRMSVIAFAIRMVSAAIAFISQVLMARWMGSFEYGIFVLVWTTMVIVGNISCLGFHTSVIRFIPEYRQKEMPAELRGVIYVSRTFVLLVSSAVAALGVMLVLLLSQHLESYYVVPFVLGLVCLPMIALSDLLQGISRAFAWAFFALSPTYLVRPVLILAFMTAALWAGYPPDARTALIAAIAATWATTVWQLVAMAGNVARHLEPGPRRHRFRKWLVVSLPIFLVEGFFFLLTNADVLMVGFFMDPDYVAVYFATMKTMVLVHFVYFAVKAGVAQRYAAYAHGDQEKLTAFARETVAWTFWPSLAMGIVVLALGKPMLMLFGPNFVSGYPLLFPLVAAVVARATVGPSESLLTMSGNQNICALIYALTLALNVALSVTLIPMLGLWGAAIATATAMLFEASALSFVVWRRLGIVMAIFLTPR